MRRNVIGWIPCTHARPPDNCSYRIAVVEANPQPGRYLYIEVDVKAERIHYRYAHQEEAPQ